MQLLCVPITQRAGTGKEPHKQMDLSKVPGTWRRGYPLEKPELPTPPPHQGCVNRPMSPSMPGNGRRLAACGLAALLVISTWAAAPGEAVPVESETIADPAEDPRCRWETPLSELPEWCLAQVTGPSLITAIPDPRPSAADEPSGDDEPGGQGQGEQASRPDPVILKSQPPQPSPAAGLHRQ